MSFTPNRTKNRIIVGESGHFKTIPLALTWLHTSGNMTGPMELFLEDGIYNISDTISINLPYFLNIRGYSTKSCILSAFSGLSNKPMFSLSSDVWIERVQLYGGGLESYGALATENAINILDTSYHEITNMSMNTFYNGINITGAAQLWFSDSVVSNMTANGIIVDSTGATSVDIEINTFYNCQNCINLNQSTAGEWHIINNLFTNVASNSVGVVYNPTNYIYTDDPVGCGNTWNNIGNFSTGFDYSRADGRDANIYVVGNSGREDKKPHFKATIANNSLTTTVTTAGTYYKALFTNSSTYTCKWTMANNRYTYQPRNRSDIPVWVSGNVSVDQPNKIVNICVRKNNTTNYTPMAVRCTSQDQPYSFSLIGYISDMGPGDYIEVFVTSSSNGDIVRIWDLNIYADAK